MSRAPSNTRPRGRSRNASEQVDQRGLPAPLGPISAWRAAALNAQRHFVGGRDAVETLDQRVGLQHDISHA